MKACEILKDELASLGVKAQLFDLARTDLTAVLAEIFKYDSVVLASATYNAEMFVHMRELINHLVERNFQSRNVALIENGSWAPTANKAMLSALEKCKNLTFYENKVTIRASVKDENITSIKELAKEIASK